jgi:hypothetical protein
MSLFAVPVDWETARAYTGLHHRHHKRPPARHKTSIGLVGDGGELHGIAMVGRPSARGLQDGLTLEVTRCTTDGTRNACSMLYASAWRYMQGAGYWRGITYTQDGETGASLRAAGWVPDAELRPRPGWDTPSRRRQPDGTEDVARTRWKIVRHGYGDALAAYRAKADFTAAASGAEPLFILAGAS